jgi:hypothetical protein
MSKYPDAAEKLSDWASEAGEIRQDEPPTMWAVYATCWNQTVERYYGTNTQQHFRKVGWIRSVVGSFIQFTPQDFPLAIK